MDQSRYKPEALIYQQMGATLAQTSICWRSSTLLSATSLHAWKVSMVAQCSHSCEPQCMLVRGFVVEHLGKCALPVSATSSAKYKGSSAFGSVTLWLPLHCFGANVRSYAQYLHCASDSTSCIGQQILVGLRSGGLLRVASAEQILPSPRSTKPERATADTPVGSRSLDSSSIQPALRLRQVPLFVRLMGSY